MPYYKKNTLNRINKFFRILQDKYYEEIAPLSCTAYVTREPVPFEQRFSGEKKELKKGDVWGELFDCAWFQFKGTIPENIEHNQLYLLIDISGEGLCWDEEKGPLLGITNGSAAFENATNRKRAIPISLCRTNGNHVELWIDGACNGLFGDYHDGKLREARIALRHTALRDLHYDFFVLKEAMAQLPIDSPQAHSILNKLNRCVNTIYDFTEEEAVEARAILKPELDKKGGDPSLSITAIGHAHIDLAWLWPIRETKRKALRTFTTVLHNMELYPDYKFGFSQPQLLQWVKEEDSALYEKLKDKVKEGRIECQGGMWVEADTNLSSGEALVRQVLYGTRFWKNEFDVDVDNIWLPDVFGYTGALPQIMAKSGLKYFMTQKLSWNEHNVFPHHTYYWYGIDGSSVLTHMLPEETYNSPASPQSIRLTEKNFKEKGISDEALLLFGIGDGGGGPGTCHLEKLERLKNFAGFSPVSQGFASDFFHRIDNDTTLPEWHGELYFEFHRGTYTSQAKNKRFNRKMEFALRELEYASVLSMLVNGTYPQEKLDQIWKEVLLYQFHDILPGSSIKRVYDESIERYETLLAETNKLIHETYQLLCNGETAFNSLSFARKEYVFHNEGWFELNLPALGSSNLTPVTLTEGIKAEDNKLENNCLKVSFNTCGEITSIYDKKNNKEVLTDSANRFSIYDDRYGNAWDIEITYDEQLPKAFRHIGSRAYFDGPNACMEQIFEFGKSKIKQNIILQKDSPMLVFDIRVDWQETEKMLRTAFSTCVETSDVTCDIQFGNLKRPTHRNTSWDMTRFEICAHKWVDLSRDDYGVALLSDSKYGFKAEKNVIDINLLRSTMSPGVDSDKGTHEFKYALLPHAGNEKVANVEQAALAFNVPPVVVYGTAKDVKQPPLFTCDSAHIEVSAVKKAEDSKTVIVRLFETYGVAENCCITLSDKITGVILCNLMEKEETMLTLKDNAVIIPFKPFEIITLKLSF